MQMSMLHPMHRLTGILMGMAFGPTFAVPVNVSVLDANGSSLADAVIAIEVADTGPGLSPAEMDFTEGKHAAAREIALAFGVPPQLLGIPGDATYANYREANAAFWRGTVVPLAERAARALTGWLAGKFPGARIAPDLDAVPALSAERDALWSRLETASFLTDAERRRLAGLEH